MDPAKQDDRYHLEHAAETGGCLPICPTQSETFNSEPKNFPVERPRSTKVVLGHWSRTIVPSEKLRVPLYLQAFSTGALDATTFADFRTFASNQTGNTILLTLAAFDTVPVSIAYTATSLGSFVVSSFIAGHMGHHIGKSNPPSQFEPGSSFAFSHSLWIGARTRWWLLLSSIIQIMLLVAFIGIQHSMPAVIDSPHGWALMLLLGSSAGLQVAMARHVGCPEIPTAMLSSPLVDFVTDPMLFRRWSDPESASRNRRTLYVFSIISGSFCGSAIQRYQGTVATVLFATCIKAVMTIIMGFS